MERGRKYIYIFSTASFLFSSFFFLSIVSSGSEQQTITHTRLIRRALCGVLRRSRVGAWSNFLFLFLYFYGVRIYFYEAISKLKRSISLVERRRNGEEEGRSVMMRGGGGESPIAPVIYDPRKMARMWTFGWKRIRSIWNMSTALDTEWKKKQNQRLQ